MIQSKRMKYTGYVDRMEEKRNACRVLVGKPEENRPLGRPRCRMENNIRIDLGEVGWSMEWTGTSGRLS
jgi:hypothetical protein